MTAPLSSWFRFDAHLAGRIVRLAGPVVVAMLVQTLINVVDMLLVGHLPPERATPGQAAMEVSIVLLWFFGGFLGAVAVGTQALTARRVGEGDPQRAGEVLTNALAIALVSTTVVSIALWFATPWVFPLLNKDEAVLEVGLAYWRWRLIGMLSMVGTLAVKSFFDGIGQTHVHMVVSIVMNVVNLVLAYGLIFGRLGFPRMEVEGAGIAAIVSSYAGLFMMLGALWLPEYRNRYPYLRWRNLSKRISSEIARLSIPSGIATMVMMTGFALFYRIVAETDVLRGGGTTYFTATSIIVRVLSLLFIAALGYGTATATLVSQSMGEERPDMAERYGWEAVRIGVWVGAALAVLTFAFAPQILSAFTKDRLVILAAIPALRFAALFEPLMVAALVFAQAHFGAGNSRLVMTVEASLHFGWLVPATYLLGLTLGLEMMGIWTAVGGYVALLSFVLGWKFRQGRWKQIRI